MVTAAMKLKDTPWKKSYDKPREHTKKQKHYFAHKSPLSQSYDFSSIHVQMWELDYKASWALKNWWFWTRCWRSHLRVLWTAEIQTVHPIGNQPWIFTGRTDAESETPILLATWCKELTHWKRPWCWERVKEGKEGDDRGWDYWMASLTQWTWVWESSGCW